MSNVKYHMSKFKCKMSKAKCKNIKISKCKNVNMSKSHWKAFLSCWRCSQNGQQKCLNKLFLTTRKRWKSETETEGDERKKDGFKGVHKEEMEVSSRVHFLAIASGLLNVEEGMIIWKRWEEKDRWVDMKFTISSGSGSQIPLF